MPSIQFVPSLNAEPTLEKMFKHGGKRTSQTSICTVWVSCFEEGAFYTKFGLTAAGFTIFYHKANKVLRRPASSSTIFTKSSPIRHEYIYDRSSRFTSKAYEELTWTEALLKGKAVEATLKALSRFCTFTIREKAVFKWEVKDHPDMHHYCLTQGKQKQL